MLEVAGDLHQAPAKFENPEIVGSTPAQSLNFFKSLFK